MITDSKPQPQAAPAEAASHENRPRAAYRAPVLRKLGSVRELTLGSAGLMADGGVTRRMF